MLRRVVVENKRRKSKLPKGAAEDDPVLGVPRPKKGRTTRHQKAVSKALPKEKASRIGLTRGYSVGVVQGKDVTFALNVPANVLAPLMGKDP